MARVGEECGVFVGLRMVFELEAEDERGVLVIMRTRRDIVYSFQVQRFMKFDSKVPKHLRLYGSESR